MGFSSSAAVAILFVGLLVAIGIAFPALEGAYDRQTTAMEDRDERTLDVRNTAINVTADYDDGASTLTVNVTNDGSTTFAVERTDLLVDGDLLSITEYDTAVDGDGNRSIVQPGETLQLTVDGIARPDRVKVVTEGGVAETLTGV